MFFVFILQIKMEKAFTIFVQHWLKKENVIKAAKSKENAKKACKKIIINRRAIYQFFVNTFEVFDDSIEDNDQMLEMAVYLTRSIKSNSLFWKLGN